MEADKLAWLRSPPKAHPSRANFECEGTFQKHPLYLDSSTVSTSIHYGITFSGLNYFSRVLHECPESKFLPMIEVKSSGAELPAAMKDAPATSSCKCSFWGQMKSQSVAWNSFQTQKRIRFWDTFLFWFCLCRLKVFCEIPRCHENSQNRSTPRKQLWHNFVTQLALDFSIALTAKECFHLRFG